MVGTCRAAALSIGFALMVGARSVAAQTYTLDFSVPGSGAGTVCKSPNPCGANAPIIATYGSQAGTVSALNGFLTGFGDASAAPSNDQTFTSLFWAQGGCCGMGVNNGTAYVDNVSHSNAGIGAFFFTAIGSSTTITLNSLLLGLNNNVEAQGSHTGDVRIYDLLNNLLYSSTPTIVGGQAAGVPAAVIPGICAVGGLKVEWGPGNVVPFRDYNIDNINYTAGTGTCGLAPEPGELSLVGLGLVSLAPLGLLRRRRRSA